MCTMFVWPRDIVAAFARALEIEPAKGLTSGEVIRAMLDMTARRAVWRCRGDAKLMGDALRAPYTPLGSVCGDGMAGKAVRFVLKGAEWGPAVNAFHDYVEKNAQAIIDAFPAERYDDTVSLCSADENGQGSGH
jgi:hypothetical protein